MKIVKKILLITTFLTLTPTTTNTVFDNRDFAFAGLALFSIAGFCYLGRKIVNQQSAFTQQLQDAQADQQTLAQEVINVASTQKENATQFNTAATEFNCAIGTLRTKLEHIQTTIQGLERLNALDITTTLRTLEDQITTIERDLNKHKTLQTEALAKHNDDIGVLQIILSQTTTRLNQETGISGARQKLVKDLKDRLTQMEANWHALSAPEKLEQLEKSMQGQKTFNKILITHFGNLSTNLCKLYSRQSFVKPVKLNHDTFPLLIVSSSYSEVD